MIESIGQSLAAPALASPQPTGGGGGETFDAALKAAQQAAQRAESHRQERAAIEEKGFTAWVRDTRMEKLKEELRKKVMADMGLDADSLTRLDSAMRNILEQKIEEAVTQRMTEALKQEEDGKARSVVAAQPGKNDRGGISCPVIPALVEPGGASLF